MNLNLLSNILSISAYSGYEDNMLNFIYQSVKTSYGGLILTKTKDWLEVSNSRDNSKDIIFLIHCDEVGFKLIEQDNIYLLESIGNPLNISYIGAKGSVNGNVGIVSLERESCFYEKEINCDHLQFHLLKNKTGLNNNLLNFKDKFSFHNEGVIGKGLDNKIGIYLVLESLFLLKSVNKNITFLFTTKEEIKLTQYPDSLFEAKEIICIDAFSTVENDCNRSEGSILSFSSNFNKNKKDSFLNMLDINAISYQLSSIDNKTGTELDLVLSDLRNKNTQPFAIFSYPLSFLHSFHEIASFNDIKYCQRALNAYLLF